MNKTIDPFKHTYLSDGSGLARRFRPSLLHKMQMPMETLGTTHVAVLSESSVGLLPQSMTVRQSAEPPVDGHRAEGTKIID